MYQISDFSKISNTPIQTLRYYDNLELLKPKIIGSIIAIDIIMVIS
jgi:DNA-binding transcriptional MerR regulator